MYKMLPTEEEMKEFVREIPPTAKGKLEALNKFFFREKDMDEAFRQMNTFFLDLIGNNPDYLQALKDCKTEEEIKQATENFFRNNPKMVQETILSFLAVKRDKWEEQEKKKEDEKSRRG